MESPLALDTPDRKVKEDILASPAQPLFPFHQSLWRKENPEPPEAVGFLASPDPEGTRVCQVCPGVRVCLDFPVLQSRVKDSQDSLGFPGAPDLQASPDQREKLESWDSPEHLEKGVMMAHLVYLETPENLVGLVAKVNPETHLVTLELQELKACQETQASQVDVAVTVPPVTAAFQEAQVSPGRKEVLVREDGLE